MTAINTPVRQGQSNHDFERGMLVGGATTALLAASLLAAAIGSGLVGTQAPEAAAPVVQAPAADHGQRIGPRMPHTTVDRNQRINESNPHQQGPIQAW